MKTNLTHHKIILFCFILFAFVSFVITRRPPESVVQNDFASWLANVESKSPDLGDTPISLKITGKTQEKVMAWQLTTLGGRDSENNEHVLRLLGLVREANLLSRDRGENGEFQINVNSGETHYQASFNINDVKGNLPLGNLLKLAEIYSTAKTPEENTVVSQNLRNQ